MQGRCRMDRQRDPHSEPVKGSLFSGGMTRNRSESTHYLCGSSGRPLAVDGLHCRCAIHATLNLSIYMRRRRRTCPGPAILDRMVREIRSKLCLDCGVRMKLVQELSWLGPGLPAVQLFQCRDCGHVENGRMAGGACRARLTSEPTGNLIPWHAGFLPGWVARGPAFPRKAACRPGGEHFSVQGRQRAHPRFDPFSSNDDRL
jgi:hypothetical protein